MNTLIQKVIGIRLDPDFSNTKQLQDLFTLYGNIIKTRLGLNHLDDAELGLRAIILLELYGDESQIGHFSRELLAVEGLKLGVLQF